ncbi:MAG: glycoside hydrolase family protein [Cyclobacteriaceae bacterium]
MKVIQFHILLIILSIGSLFFNSCQPKNAANDKKADMENAEFIPEKKTLWGFDSIPKSVQSNFFNQEISGNVIVDPEYWTWGASVIKWSDGKYHAFYSRWKKEYGWKGWMTDSEIAHGVSDKMEGPYEFMNVVLGSRLRGGWESATSHNPSVCVVDGQIFLYYISVDLHDVYQETEETYPVTKWIMDHWDIARNRQLIGLAIASDPNGEFVRTSEPVVKPVEGVFKNIAVNPAVTYVNGKFTMIMKGDDIKYDKAFRIQLAGHSSKPEGPFEFEKEPVYNEIQTEDATIWYDKMKEQYFMVCHVNSKPELMVMSSKDSYQWKPASNPLFTRKEILLDNGETWKPQKMERPFVLTDDQGQPLMLFVAIKDKEISGNIAIPIR